MQEVILVTMGKTQPLTIKYARKVLGKLAENVSDEQLEKEIKAAQLLKSLFFNQIKDNKDSETVYNKDNG